jgi:hypothetical protein
LTLHFILLYAAEHFFINTFHGPRKNIASIVKEACLLIRCLAMDVLFLPVGSRGNVFTESLPSNGHTRHNIIFPSTSNSLCPPQLFFL